MYAWAFPYLLCYSSTISTFSTGGSRSGALHCVCEPQTLIQLMIPRLDLIVIQLRSQWWSDSTGDVENEYKCLKVGFSQHTRTCIGLRTYFLVIIYNLGVSYHKWLDAIRFSFLVFPLTARKRLAGVCELRNDGTFLSWRCFHETSHITMTCNTLH